MTNRNVSSLVLSVLFLALGLYIFWTSFGLIPTSARFPRLVGGALSIAAFFASLQSIWVIRRAVPAVDGGGDGVHRFSFHTLFTDYRRALIVVALTVLYAASISFLGFYPASGIYMILVGWVLYSRAHMIAIVLTAAAMVLGIYMIFGLLLNMRLPPFQLF